MKWKPWRPGEGRNFSRFKFSTRDNGAVTTIYDVHGLIAVLHGRWYNTTSGDPWLAVLPKDSDLQCLLLFKCPLWGPLYHEEKKKNVSEQARVVKSGR